MQIHNIEAAFREVMSVQLPWVIKDVAIYHKNKLVEVSIGFVRGSRFSCPECGHECGVHDSVTHRWRYLDFFDYRCYITMNVPRVRCEKHGVRTLKETPWGRMGSHYSFMVEQQIMKLSSEMSMSALSKHIGEPDSNLWRVFNYYVFNAVNNDMDLSMVRRVAVDEKSQKRGHIYVTIFSDLDTGNVIYVTEGRKKDVFSEFRKWLPKHGGDPELIELFSMDMSVSYKAGRAEYFKKADEVYDRFHIKKGLNEAVDKVRKAEVKHSDELKKTKYIWLMDPRRLNSYQEIKLNDFLRESTLKTANAYQMKIAFDQLWKVHPSTSEQVLNAWLLNADQSGIRPILSFVNTVRKNFKGILNSIKSGITNAVAEGINSKIQTAKSRAKGFRNMDNFKSMIYFLGNKFDFGIH